MSMLFATLSSFAFFYSAFFYFLEVIKLITLHFVELRYDILESTIDTRDDDMIYGIHSLVDNFDYFMQSYEGSFQRGQSNEQFYNILIIFP